MVELAKCLSLGRELPVEFSVWASEAVADGIRQPVLGRLRRPVQSNVSGCDVRVELQTRRGQAGRESVLILL